MALSSSRDLTPRFPHLHTLSHTHTYIYKYINIYINIQMEELKRSILEQGSIVEGFGAKADAICNQALEEFAQAAPDAGEDDTTSSLIFDTISFCMASSSDSAGFALALVRGGTSSATTLRCEVI